MEELFSPVIFTLESEGINVDKIIREFVCFLRPKCSNKSIKFQQCNEVEYLISPLGPYYKSRIAWMSEFAREKGKNKYSLDESIFDNNIGCFNMQSRRRQIVASSETEKIINYYFLVNHDKKIFIDKRNIKHSNQIDLLPILTLVLGNSNLKMKFLIDSEILGIWAYDTISVEKIQPIDYKEKIFCLRQNYDVKFEYKYRISSLIKMMKDK